ncbi:hypothetical protein [uncultured Cohaesibacter sp.]|uniref:hypothetical protein n=1 Tax=uncultured Cohaesibacter sp. TaxID=1002546 RepID=UPI0029C95235|nr:hypothetical protein [uncultured Cohaesibacter sp.]
MKISTAVAGMLAAMFAEAALAGDGGGAPGGMSTANLPLGVLAQINLGSSGLMTPYYSDEYFGLTQNRTGTALTGENLKAHGGATSGYVDEAFALATNAAFMFALSENSYVNFQIGNILDEGSSNLVEVDGVSPKLEAEYILFPNPDTMFSVSAFVEENDLDTSETTKVDRKSYGFRADAIRKFSEHWGVTGRIQYSPGTAVAKTYVMPGLVLRDESNDDRLYTQLDLVGNYRAKDWDVIPDGWVLYPGVGGNFLRTFMDDNVTGGDSFDYGMAWARLNLSMESQPRKLIPNIVIGFEHEWVDDLEDYTDEENYALIGGGLMYSLENGNNINFNAGAHHGLNGNRSSYTFAINTSLNF